MTALTNASEDNFLDLFFQNGDWAEVGDATGLRGSVTAGVLGIAIHDSDAISDTTTLQATNEIAYTGYTRPTVARSIAGWTVATGICDNDAAIVYGEMTAGGPDTATDVSIGEAAGDPSTMFMWGQLAADLVINNGVDPQFAAGALDISAN